MDTGFWKKLKKPFFVLAPMANVTDAAFRRIIAKYSKWGGRDIFDEQGKFTLPNLEARPLNLGGPDVMWTEFVSADGLCHPKGREKLLIDLQYSEAERPIVAQLFGANPEKMREAAALIQKLGFDGLDINMGCPDKTIEKQGAGAAMIRNPKQARAILRAAKEGSPNLPISVKTRVGYNKDELELWLPEILAEEPASVTIHARTRKEMSKVPARWGDVGRAVEIRNKLGSKTLIIGNGDLKDLADAEEKVKISGADGAMLGRAIFGNPWLFGGKRPDLKSGERSGLGEPTVSKKLSVMLEHTKLFEELLGKHKSFSIMKKHYKAYVEGFDARPNDGSVGRGAKELRTKLMETENEAQVENIVGEFLKKL